MQIFFSLFAFFCENRVFLLFYVFRGRRQRGFSPCGFKGTDFNGKLASQKALCLNLLSIRLRISNSFLRNSVRISRFFGDLRYLCKEEVGVKIFKKIPFQKLFSQRNRLFPHTLTLNYFGRSKLEPKMTVFAPKCTPFSVHCSFLQKKFQI